MIKMRCRKAKIWIKEEMNIEMPEGRIDGGVVLQA